MKWAISILMLCCLAPIGVVSGAEIAANQIGAVEAIVNETPTHIFLQEGTNGSFVKDVSDNYTLTITDVIPYTVYFSDRPARDAGMVEMEQFLEGFNFDPNNPPNALVTIREGEEEKDMIVVELTEPSYNNATNTLMYKAHLTADYEFESEWPQDLTSRADEAIPEEFGEVIIIIDDCPCIPDPWRCKSYWSNSCWSSEGKRAPFCNPCGGCC